MTELAPPLDLGLNHPLAHPAVRGGKPGEYGRGCVGRAVIHHEQLQSRQTLPQDAQGRGLEVRGAITHRHQNRHQRRVAVDEHSAFAAFLVEGVFDYLTASAWRLAAFSPCGTHLPADRLGFLARAEVIYGVLDGDAAGEAAGQRFRQQLGPRFRPLRLPDGCDLNDLARRPDGRQVFFHLLAQARYGRKKENSHA